MAREANHGRTIRIIFYCKTKSPKRARPNVNCLPFNGGRGCACYGTRTGIGSSTLGVEMKSFPGFAVARNVFAMLSFPWQKVASAVRIGRSQMHGHPNEWNAMGTRRSRMHGLGKRRAGFSAETLGFRGLEPNRLQRSGNSSVREQVKRRSCRSPGGYDVSACINRRYDGRKMRSPRLMSLVVENRPADVL